MKRWHEFHQSMTKNVTIFILELLNNVEAHEKGEIKN